jgi:hypothetical protein
MKANILKKLQACAAMSAIMALAGEIGVLTIHTQSRAYESMHGNCVSLCAVWASEVEAWRVSATW